ncbi:MAG: roadblock/LC7 domain-containing protein [Myxococcota bacterium]
MGNINLAPLSEIEGYVASAVVDRSSGMLMGEHGQAPFSLELAGAGNTEVIKAKMRTMQTLALAEKIEDILITLDTQYHIIRPVETADHVFLYVVLNKQKANLAMARHVIRDFEKKTVL